MTDYEGKLYYTITFLVLTLIIEPVVGLACIIWFMGLGLQKEENVWLCLIWYRLGVIPSIYIAMFVADLFN